jgi:hypothetical protein
MWRLRAPRLCCSARRARAALRRPRCSRHGRPATDRCSHAADRRAALFASYDCGSLGPPLSLNDPSLLRARSTRSPLPKPGGRPTRPARQQGNARRAGRLGRQRPSPHVRSHPVAVLGAAASDSWPALSSCRVRLSEAAAEPANERDRLTRDGAARGGGVAAAGGCGGPHQAVVIGGSAEVGDVWLGDDEGDLGMHGWTSLRCGAGTVICAGCSGLAVG